MEEYPENEVAEISRINMDGIIDNQLSTIEEKDRIIKNQRRELLEMKKPTSKRFWVKVYKDSDISFLSFRNRGILFSLCQLVGKNKGGYLEDKETGGIIETWAQLGKNIGIKDTAHTSTYCKKLVDSGVLIVERISDCNVSDDKVYKVLKEVYEKNHSRGLHPDNAIKKRHFRLNPQYVSIGKEKKQDV